jgi:hypothetical protein
MTFELLLNERSWAIVWPVWWLSNYLQRALNGIVLWFLQQNHQLFLGDRELILWLCLEQSYRTIFVDSQSIWCIEDHCILTSKISIRARLSVLSVCRSDIVTPFSHAWQRWRLDRTALTILRNYRVIILSKTEGGTIEMITIIAYTAYLLDC